MDGHLQVGLMMRNAPRLRTIELDFWNPSQPDRNLNNLSQVLVEHYHWPNLSNVELHGFRASEIHLRGFLAAHAASLTSLDLGTIMLLPYEWKGKPRSGSWIRLIIFLQESLNLRKMCFHSTLASGGVENWLATDADMIRRIGTKQNASDLTVKERVERYVVEGGEFPLPWPSETEDESRWRDVLLEFQSKSDATWGFYQNRR